MNLHFEKYGEQGQALIILHGLFGSADNWSSLGKQLGRNFNVYLVDQRNHGKSPHDDEWTYKAMAADIKEFIAQQQIDSPIILGHSMGGKTAMEFAATYSDALSKLIVADIAPKYYPVHHRTIIDGLLAVDANPVSSRKEADAILADFIPELPVRQFLLKNLVRNDEGGFNWRMNLPVIDQNIENVGYTLPDGVQLDVATLFVRGANSNYIDEEAEKKIDLHFTNYQLETIENAGHWVHAEKPKEFLEMITNFILDE